MAASRDRNAGLLNLLKFSGAGKGPKAPPSEPENQFADAAPALHHQMSGSSSYVSQQHQVQASPSSQPDPHEEPLNISTSRHPPLLAPAPSSADPTGLLAALMRGVRENDDESQDHPPPVSHHQPAGPPAFEQQSSPPSNTRAYLLNLLNQPKPSQNDQQYRGEPQSNNLTPQSGDLSDPSRAMPGAGRNYGPMPGMPAYEFEQRAEPQRVSSYHSYNSQESHGHNAANAAFPPSNRGSGMEWPGYGQPVEELGAQDAYGPQPHADFHNGPASYQILKKPQTSESPAGSQDRLEGYGHHQSYDSPSLAQEHASRKTDYAPSADETLVERHPGSSEFYSNTAVPDKVMEALGEAVNDDLDATSRESPAHKLAEEVKAEAETAEDIDQALGSTSRRSLDLSPKYPTRDDNSDSQDPYAGVEGEARHVADKLQAVADSWDSADAEDVGLAGDESAPPITVYNFPMQPWISIAMSASEKEERPEFRECAIMDIARLKKDFDQVDRNLYTASPHCMAYGMSKAGGMHVIRQDDGKDIKVFSNTKDRIFNISMSVTPQDHYGVHREAIMGTGVSGTVYWVQVLDGEKDHIEDAHPEQYGFALPPLSSQEGDTSGGVLKTRARVSSCHPEFFAVGRGKSITIVWPYFVMQERLFKAEHDRIVDAEKLAKHCSLKINTGKAGKDFTFSQDDSVIVSLDKSGRVKFWDVRDLTTASEDSDPNYPVPAHTSLEIKDPIMTLASTPEGEKAWPTSVLLLDKIKPYQKRCALRYMIVGMKQNHTLQLWDLALGKPVQEFNLPHSKESDAVCSVTYNPASGMIVIGHPTRNSIYMAHLSAPKYTFKNISQADYIMRLGTKDISIPAPESTAVISGLREYSFANKGILRSLDMLSNPAMQHEADEPTLFELYAMHSKGVACILIRQPELGWSKDNKVVQGVDAVKTGVITVTPLKPLGPQPAEEPIPSKQTPRPGKDGVLAAIQQDESPRKPSDSASPVKIQTRKDTESAATPTTPGTAPEKAEKKGRKGKKAAAAAAAAQAAADAQANGSTPSSGAKGNTAAAKGGDSGRGPATSQKATLPSVSQEVIESSIKGMETRLQASISAVLETALGSLSKTILARESDFDSRQLKLLDVVSEVLNQNVQGVLDDIISKQFEGSVIPSIADATSRAAADQVSAKAVHTIQKELNKALPGIGEKVVMNEALVDALSDKIGARVAGRVHDEVMHDLTNNLIPTITNVTVQASHRVAGEIQQQYQEQLDRLEAQRRADANKVDQLLSLVTRLSDTVSTMAATQSQFQGEFLKFQQQQAAPEREHGRQGPPLDAPVQSPPYMMHQGPQPPPQQHPRHQLPQIPHESPAEQAPNPEEELNRQINLINQSVRERRMEEAIIRWLQSGLEDEIFARYWSNLSPVYLRDLPPLVLLSVATTVSQHLETALARQKTAWLEMSVHCLLNSVPTFVSFFRDLSLLPPAALYSAVLTRNQINRISKSGRSPPTS